MTIAPKSPLFEKEISHISNFNFSVHMEEDT